MKKVWLGLLLASCVSACNAQNKQNEKQQNQITATGENKPQVSWKVNKKYDHKGDLVGYDSTYTWSYSSKGKSARWMQIV